MREVMKGNTTKGIICLNVVGIFLYAIGINCFAAPHNIAPGGASGIAIIVNFLCGFPIGVFTFLFNVPFLILIWVKGYFPRDFVYKTLLSSLFLSFVTDVIVTRMPVYQGDPLLASMFAGVLMGGGLALVHMGRSNTGGISLIGVIIQKHAPHFQVGTLISLLNMTVILASGIVYRNVENLLYALVTVYISGLFMDKWLDNASAKNLMIIMSECTDKVRQILVDSQKSITILQGEGGYTSRRQRVILCAATKEDCEEIEKTIKQVDQESLIIVTHTMRVEGKGFKHIM